MSYAGGSGGGKISSSGDVALSNPGTGQILTYNTSLQKWVNQAAPITSVAGKTGDVTLSAGDVGALTSSSADLKYAPRDTTAQTGISPVYSMPSSSTITLPDVSVATIHNITLNSNTTINFPLSAVGKRFTVVLTQDATGSRTVTWPSNAVFSGGTAPALSSGAKTITILHFMCVDGVNWLGYLDASNIPAPSSSGSGSGSTNGSDQTIDDINLVYTGAGWQVGTDAGTYGSGDHYTRTAGDSLTYSAQFTAGGTISVMAKKADHHGIMTVSVDGGSAANVDLYAAADTYQVIVYTSPALSAGTHSITITATSNKNAASTEAVAEIDALVMHNMVAGTGSGTTTPGSTPSGGSSATTGIDVTIDDGSLTYAGSGWQTGGDAGTYGSGDHYADASGNSASFTASFVAGGTFAVIAKKAPHHGIMSVAIDGNAAGTADLYAAADDYQETVFTSSALTAGSHSISVAWTGNKNGASTGTVAEIDALFLHNAVQGTAGSSTAPNSGGGSTGGSTGGASPTGFLTRSGNKVYLNGAQWRGAGTNLPWSEGCGSEVGLPPSIAQHQAMFAAAKPNSIYRIWLFKGYSYTTFDNILNAARPYGHRFIPVLCDGASGCGESGRDNNFFNGGWISSGWRDQWLTPTVNRYKNEPLIGWWEWVNEPSLGQPLRNFYDGVGAYVRNTLGDQHLIGTGCMSEYGNSGGMQLVNASSYIDLCSMHEYDETQYPSSWASKDAADAAAVGKPFYVGEYGIKPGNDQTGGIAKKLAAYKAMPTCCAAIYWSTGAPGNGRLNSSNYEIATNGAPQNVINNFSML